jgi:sterol desaturase/sphingolipid hydroxylase (fatty acid hydroxylase superfamily)
MGRIAAVLAMGGYIAALFVAERLRPLRRPTRALAERLPVNLAFGLIAAATVAAVVTPVAMRVMTESRLHRSGIVPRLPLSRPAEFLLVFLLMDATFYWWHRANHRLPFLWRFHVTHHIDPDLDVTTAFRFHFGELALSAGFRVLQIGLIAPSLPAYLLYEAVFQAGTLFHHSNLRLPKEMDRRFNLLIVTPRMHGIHHSQVREETNSNYGTVFSFWDRLHRTLRRGVPQREIAIGVPGYSLPDDNRLFSVLAFPFLRQRGYWRRPDGDVGGMRGRATEE